MELPDAVRENSFQVVTMGLGLLVLMYGVGQMMVNSQGDELVVIEPEESIASSTAVVKETVIVDVAGAVINPGVYEMEEGMRIADVLEQAGGYSDDVDTAYVARFINQADKLIDGQKIYVPPKGENTIGVGDNQQVSLSDSGVVAGSKVINVNTASESDLDTLWGIGEARAADIVANRPYASLEELKDKAGIPQNVLEKNEGKIGL